MRGFLTALIGLSFVFVAPALGPVSSAEPAAGQGAAGAISGHVKLTTKVRGTALPTPMYPTRAVGHQATPSIPEIRNVVVYLKGVTYRGTLTPARAELRQQDETFVPHLVAIGKGSFVDFPNGDPFFHNVFSLSGAATFDLGRYREGETRAWRFNKAGLVKVFCHIHSHMSATIFVLDHPYFAIPEADGGFQLRGIPPGDYTIAGWHERVGERTAAVRVEAGRSATVNLSLPVEDAP